MKPLAILVIGGMVTSLLHVLVVTPVIFAWLREREMRRGSRMKHDGAPSQLSPARSAENQEHEFIHTTA